MRKAVPALLLCLSATACAGMHPGTSPTAFDGTYNGMTSATHVTSLSCGSMDPKPGSLVVQNGAVVWTSPLQQPMYAPVMADGAFAVNENATFLSGKITGTTMVARYNNGACHVIYDLKKAA